ncbi:MAG: hypothetical protein DHS80DRAFT_29016, partial [Piptocephalis tieghemiana]
MIHNRVSVFVTLALVASAILPQSIASPIALRSQAALNEVISTPRLHRRSPSYLPAAVGGSALLGAGIASGYAIKNHLDREAMANDAAIIPTHQYAGAVEDCESGAPPLPSPDYGSPNGPFPDNAMPPPFGAPSPDYGGPGADQIPPPGGPAPPMPSDDCEVDSVPLPGGPGDLPPPTGVSPGQDMPPPG